MLNALVHNLIRSRFFLVVLALFAAFLPSVAHAQAEPADDRYHIGVVESVIAPEGDAFDPYGSTVETRVRIEPDDGDARVVDATFNDSPATDADDLRPGERVVVLETRAFVDETRFIVTDRYRVPALAWLLAGFFAVAVAFAGVRGITSGLGLAFSLLVLLGYTVPTIAKGGDPFLTATISAFAIAVVSLTVAHGFARQTFLALASTLATLVISLGLSQWFVSAANLFGMGSEDAFYLQFGEFGAVNLRGILLAGIVIGVLGVLDDVTTAQTAAIKELKESAAHFTARDLVKRGLSIGREHIVSLVNTLALAYAGASLPLLLLFSTNEGRVPTWVILNGEMIAEEVVRTLVGSTALVLAVPISTLIAAAYYGRRPRH